MDRGRVAVVIVVASVAAAAAMGAGRGWFRHPPPAGQAVAVPPEQNELQNATRAVELIARAAAEPRPKEMPPPPPPAPAADSEQPAPDVRWSARADASSKDGVLCGGKVCAANQFCCGPPECGRCASRLTGPRCPASCP